MTTIFVGNLRDDINTVRIRELFEQYGAVASMRVKLGSGHRFDGYVLIEMEETAARKAIAQLGGLVFGRAILTVREVADSTQQAEADPGPSATDDDEPPSDLARLHYKVTEVQKVDGPLGSDGDDWKRYVLSSKRARITGFHRGTLEEVTAYATSCAEEFNERSATGKSPRGPAYRRKQ